MDIWAGEEQLLLNHTFPPPPFNIFFSSMGMWFIFRCFSLLEKVMERAWLWLAWELDGAIRGSSLSHLSLEFTFCHSSHSGSPFQVHSVERAACCWDHLDIICWWKQLRLLYKILRFWLAGELPVLQSLKISRVGKEVAFLLNLLLTKQNGPILSPIPTCSPCLEARFKLYPGNSRGWVLIVCYSPISLVVWSSL